MSLGISKGKYAKTLNSKSLTASSWNHNNPQEGVCLFKFNEFCATRHILSCVEMVHRCMHRLYETHQPYRPDPLPLSKSFCQFQKVQRLLLEVWQVSFSWWVIWALWIIWSPHNLTSVVFLGKSLGHLLPHHHSYKSINMTLIPNS